MSKTPTDKQEIIINEKSGLFVVRACPGSGKTFTVAARLNRFLNNWEFKNQGIATISFTNVAWKEIDKYLQLEFNKEFSSNPHFLGTIDSFINTYIFLPFGHLILGCNERPILCGPPVDNYEPIGHPPYFWRNRNCHNRKCKLNDFSFNTSDEFIKVKGNNVVTECEHNPEMPCLLLKKRFNEQGFATQQDANYFAFKVVKEYPNIAKALVMRFPLMMIDEAQDTSNVQMKIIDILIENGLRELMLIGDPDQSIYEWRSADPSLFIQKYDAWSDNSLELHENKRSSQKICDFVSVISSYENMVSTNDEVANFNHIPEIWEYQNVEELQELKNRFIDRYIEFEIHEKDVAILTRGRDLLNEIVAGTVPTYGISPWKDNTDEDKRLSYLVKGLAKSRYFYDRKNFKDAIYNFEKEYWKWLNNCPVCKRSDLNEKHDEVGLTNWRSHISNLIISMPATTCSLSQWIQRANQVIQSSHGILNSVNLKIKRNSRNIIYSDLEFNVIFGSTATSSNDEECTLGTVHSVKGETYEAVMLILKKNDGNRMNYLNTVDKNIQDCEELRILYVGITRARKVFILAVPSESAERLRQKFNLEINQI